MNDSTVLLASNLAWPATVLIIAFVLLVTQREPIGGLISRIRTVRYPGGQFDTVPEGDADKIRALVDALSKDVGEPVDGDEIARPAAEAKEIQPTQNREPLLEVEPLRSEEVTNLVVLRMKVANVLTELASPPPPGGFGTISDLIDVLSNRGVLDGDQARALRDAVDVADQAAAGAIVPRKVALAVENSGPAILEQLSMLRTTAAARFEDHVLYKLQQGLPRGWSLEVNAPIGRTARVDALVRDGGRSAVVEARALVHPGALGQIAVLREWLEALPSDLPVLLVVRGEGLSSRQTREFRESREGSFEILQWDRESTSLISMLRALLATSQQLSGVS